MRRTGRTLLSPVQNRQEGRVQEHCSQEPEVGWGSRGFVSSVGSEPMLNGIPVPSCLPPCSVACEPGTGQLWVTRPGRI